MKQSQVTPSPHNPPAQSPKIVNTHNKKFVAARMEIEAAIILRINFSLKFQNGLNLKHGNLKFIWAFWIGPGSMCLYFDHQQ